jgi:hypothetical protein
VEQCGGTVGSCASCCDACPAPGVPGCMTATTTTTTTTTIPGSCVDVCSGCNGSCVCFDSSTACSFGFHHLSSGAVCLSAFTNCSSSCSADSDCPSGEACIGSGSASVCCPVCNP